MWRIVEGPGVRDQGSGLQMNPVSEFPTSPTPLPLRLHLVFSGMGFPHSGLTFQSFDFFVQFEPFCFYFVFFLFCFLEVLGEFCYFLIIGGDVWFFDFGFEFFDPLLEPGHFFFERGGFECGFAQAVLGGAFAFAASLAFAGGFFALFFWRGGRRVGGCFGNGCG